jgi:hypothetical protein
LLIGCGGEFVGACGGGGCTTEGGGCTTVGACDNTTADVHTIVPNEKKTAIGLEKELTFTINYSPYEI